MKKVIFILPHFAPYASWNANGHIPKYHWYNRDGQLFGFDGVSWGNQMFEQLIKFEKEKIHYEVWQPDPYADKVQSHTFQNGIVHKSIPLTRTISIITAFNLKREYYCRAIDELLIKDLENGVRPLILIPLNYSYITRRLIKKFGNRVAFLFQLHNNPDLDFFFSTKRLPFKKRLKRLLYFSFFNRIKYVIPSTQNNLKNWPQKKVFWRSHVSHIGVDSTVVHGDKHYHRKALNLPADRFIIFSSQRLEPNKQLDQLILALAEIKSCNFLLIISGIGSTEYTNYLKQLITDLGLTENVEFVGFVTDLLIPYYISADLFVSTSKYEAGPVSTFKAIVHKTPVLTTDTGIAYELLKEQGAGLIIKNNEVRECASVIANVCSGKLQIPLPNTDFCDQYFSWETISDYYLTVFNQIINSFYSKYP